MSTIAAFLDLKFCQQNSNLPETLSPSVAAPLAIAVTPSRPPTRSNAGTRSSRLLSEGA
jgi:hypothetical protein